MKIFNIKINHIESVKLCDISDSEYFSSKYSNYISNSKLSLINPDEDGSPEKYKSGLSENKIYSNAMEFGSAVHSMILQSNDFYLDTNIEKPSGKLSFIVDYIIKECGNLTDEAIIEACNEVKYFVGKLDKDKIIEIHNKIKPFYDYFMNFNENEYYGKTPIFLCGYDQYRLGECISSISRHIEAQKLLYPSDEFDVYNETTILVNLVVCIDTNEGPCLIPLKFKGKIDNFIMNDNCTEIILNDLKTTGKDISLFHESFFRFHYNRQIGLYLYFLRHLYPNNNISGKANIIAVQTMKPFTSHVYPISFESIQNGLKEASKLIKMVAFYEKFGYDQKIEDYGFTF